jgi:hypothetical protein
MWNSCIRKAEEGYLEYESDVFWEWHDDGGSISLGSDFILSCHKMWPHKKIGCEILPSATPEPQHQPTSGPSKGQHCSYCLGGAC